MTLNLQYNTVIEMHTGAIKHLTVCTGESCTPNSRLFFKNLRNMPVHWQGDSCREYHLSFATSEDAVCHFWSSAELILELHDIYIFKNPSQFCLPHSTVVYPQFSGLRFIVIFLEISSYQMHRLSNAFLSLKWTLELPRYPLAIKNTTFLLKVDISLNIRCV